MSDNRTPEQRSATMRAVKGKNTTPELFIRKALHALGYRYSLHRRDLPGSPDIVFPTRRKVIFIHGCFWHAHKCRLGKPPKSRLEFWGEKLKNNCVRDKRNISALRKMGWQVAVVWQCQLKKPAKTIAKLSAFLER